MRKIIISLSVVAAVAAAVVVGTTAFFSDTETSTGNTFTAGTIDIAVTSPAVWQYHLDDMKPGYTDYSNFTVKNSGSNPVNVWKKVTVATLDENGINEPECVAYNGTWVPGQPPEGACNNIQGPIKNDLSQVVKYDLSVVVKDSTGAPKWNQTLYNENKTIAEINAISDKGTFLGMIPEGWSMDVTESYHMIDTAGNEYQSDKMTFDITLTGEQLTGSVVLEDKDQVAPWRVRSGDDTMATLTYTMKADTFNFTLAGKSPVVSGNVALVAGYDSGTNADTLIGYGTTDASGVITMTGNSVELGKDLINAKVWLIPKGDWDDANKKVVGWHMSQYLWETGLIDYYDTDL